MRTRNRLTVCNARLLLTLTVLICSGCVIVPVPVKPEIEVLDAVTIAEDARVTMGPRQLLDEVAKTIIDENQNIEIIDGFTFRDTAFPDGGWRMADLLDPSIAQRTAVSLDVSHVAVIEPHKTNDWEETFSVFVPLAFGAMSGEEKSRMSVTIFDLREPSNTSEIWVTATGKARAFVLVIYGIGTEPLTLGSVYKGIAKEISAAVSGGQQKGPTRIALLAVENIESLPDLAGDRHFPVPCGDDQLPYQDEERNRHSNQRDNSPVSANSKVETGDKKADKDHCGRDKVADRCRLEVGEELVVLAVESCASHFDVSDNGH